MELLEQWNSNRRMAPMARKPGRPASRRGHQPLVGCKGTPLRIAHHFWDFGGPVANANPSGVGCLGRLRMQVLLAWVVCGDCAASPDACSGRPGSLGQCREDRSSLGADAVRHAPTLCLAPDI